MQFAPYGEEVCITYKHTLDPNEDCDDETVSHDEALVIYNASIVKQWTPATGWHIDKRDWME